MCKFYSAIVMRNGDVLHNEHLMNHEDIINLFNINDSQINCESFVRVEFRPVNDSDLPDIEKYKLMIDEGSTPEWFDQFREYTFQTLKDFLFFPLNNVIVSDSSTL